MVIITGTFGAIPPITAVLCVGVVITTGTFGATPPITAVLCAGVVIITGTFGAIPPITGVICAGVVIITGTFGATPPVTSVTVKGMDIGTGMTAESGTDTTLLLPSVAVAGKGARDKSVAPPPHRGTGDGITSFERGAAAKGAVGACHM
jgi:hypothetical protein